MSAVLSPPKTNVQQQTRVLFRLSVDQYQRMVLAGILGKHDRCELIEGLLVAKPMSRNPPHDGTVHRLNTWLTITLPPVWQARDQKALVLDDSVPEPDSVVARGDSRAYDARHPAAADVGMLAEVADTSLREDRDRCRVFARNRIPVYWVVNLVDEIVEVYTQPSGPTAVPSYASRQDYHRGDSVPLVLDGVVIASVPVNDLLP